MKYLFSLLIITSSLSYAMNKDSKIDAKEVEVLRKISCEIAFERIFKNMGNATDPEKMILIRNSSEHGIYEAFEFLLKHCSESKKS